MSLVQFFYSEFCKAYRYHRWPPTKNLGYWDGEWTCEMYKILEKTVKKLGLVERKELNRVDFNWYKTGSNVPVISLEHENGYQSIWNEEVPKLLYSNSDLKVLICYPPKNQHWDIGKQLEKMLYKEVDNNKFNGDFLLIMGFLNMYPNDPKQFTVYKYSLELKVRRLK